MELKNQANQYFKDSEYQKAIEIYTQLLEENENNEAILSNRSASYIKLEQFDLALNDAAKATKLKPDWGKAWGRLGAALYGLGRIDESLVAFSKANELEPCEIYLTMINQIKNNLNEFKEEFLETTTDNILINNVFGSMFDSVISNHKIMEKITNPEFQDKVLSYQNNPMEAMKDDEIISALSEMIKSFKL